jgi:hypothetical protein
MPVACTECRMSGLALVLLPLSNVLGLAELVDHEIARPLFDNSLDLGAFVSPEDDEPVALGVSRLVLSDGQSDQAAARIPTALAENLDDLVGSSACVLLGVLDLSVGGPKHRFVLGNSLVSLVHGTESSPASDSEA